MSIVDKWLKASLGALALTALGTSFAVASMNVLEVEFSEFPEETAAIVAATADLFDTVEAGVEPAPEIKRDRVIGDFVTPASARSDQARFGGLTDEHGPVKNLTGYRITWYPVDRFLGAVDYMGTWNGNRDLVCGHVTWDLSDRPIPDRRTEGSHVHLLEEVALRRHLQTQHIARRPSGASERELRLWRDRAELHGIRDGSRPALSRP